ncbi:hypothetical protein D3272_23555 [Lichenibacterium ramalinae]|uniref:Uncharacterized protein n=2 Tax=Lichenibacterium ramalinae TaxID=2316527 RepID=A0A4Q2R693_9HYPH|nr:hypothetical protein D3272_23555 [Lichenibacterium ramalinae]
MPIKVGGIDFDFTAALLGGNHSTDLVLVVEMGTGLDKRARQKVEGVARALDVMGSRRPLTTVVVGSRPSAEDLSGMARVCRVLPVEHLLDEADLRNRLAVLLPLRLPDPAADDVLAGGDAVPETHDEMSAALVAASLRGEAAVARLLHSLVAEPFAEAWHDRGGSS